MYHKRTITEVRTFKVKIYCDCGGEITHNGNSDMSYPPQYVHTCSDCGYTVTYPDIYPMDTTQEVGEPQVLPDE